MKSTPTKPRGIKLNSDATQGRARLLPSHPHDSRAIKLEICAASAEDCVKAERGGADRIELNSALALGGLTPSLGTWREACASCRLPIIVMIRPRAAGFCYSRSEFSVMLRDAEIALSENALGIAFGVLTAKGDVDAKRCREMMKLAAGHQIVFIARLTWCATL